LEVSASELVRTSLQRAGYKPNRAVEQGYISRWHTELARPNQLPPPGDWRIWLLLAGRGFGKTRTICEFANQKARELPGSRGALVGATASDTRDILVLGESGLLNIAEPLFRPTYNPSKRLMTWPNGSMALLFSADEPNRLRGLQHHWAICDELASWRRPEAWDMLLMGARLGDDPRIAVATTPRPIKLIKSLVADSTCYVTRGTTYENAANLAKPFMDAIIRRYEGTRLGRQELEAAILEDTPGALWKRENIDKYRVAAIPDLIRIAVAIDPAATNNQDSDETGIIVAGVSADGHGYVLDDVTIKASPAGWAKQAIAAYNKYKADRMVAETNNGGDMIENTIRTVRDESDTPIGRNISFKQVRASRGKHTRAEPIAALYEQGRVHHVGMFAELEDQMCQWMPGEDSPDRMDALVWAISELMPSAGTFQVLFEI
jgi:predicted phage terminase large subunit-like protein